MLVVLIAIEPMNRTNQHDNRVWIKNHDHQISCWLFLFEPMNRTNRHDNRVWCMEFVDENEIKNILAVEILRIDTISCIVFVCAHNIILERSKWRKGVYAHM